MTADRYREILAKLGVSMRALARYLNIDDTVTRRYGRGTKEIPDTLAEWLEMLMSAPDIEAALGSNPYPNDWMARADDAA